MSRTTTTRRGVDDGNSTGLLDDASEREVEVPAGLPTRIRFRLVGRSAILMHQDSVDWADDVSEERARPKSAREKDGHKPTKGDDRDPAWAWTGYCYNDGEHIVIPSANMLAALLHAAAKVPKKMSNYKADAAALIRFDPDNQNLKLKVHDRVIEWKKIRDLIKESRFAEHKKAVAAMGFVLDVRRANVNRKKHVRVRPRFESWSVDGVVCLSPGAIQVQKQEGDRSGAPTLREIFEIAGNYSGLFDWRPGSPSKPGIYGCFRVDAWEVIG